MALDYADVELTITSSILFLDGHTEPGPQTELRTTIHTVEAGEAIGKLIDRTISALHSESFGAGFMHGLRTIVRPGNPADDAREKMSITYHIRLISVAHFKDGTSKRLDTSQDKTKRLTSNSDI